MLTEKISEALAVAVRAHDGQVRKSTAIPYVSHPMGVASLALEFGANEDQAIAALLHDVIEDGGPQYIPEIRQRFGEVVLAIVEGCTDGVPDATGEKEDWHVRKNRYLQHLSHAPDEVLLVSGSDKLHNARAIVRDLLKDGPSVFERFSTKREGTLWYYRALAGIFSARGAPMAAALEDEVTRMEQLAV